MVIRSQHFLSNTIFGNHTHTYIHTDILNLLVMIQRHEMVLNERRLTTKRVLNFFSLLFLFSYSLFLFLRLHSTASPTNFNSACSSPVLLLTIVHNSLHTQISTVFGAGTLVLFCGLLERCKAINRRQSRDVCASVCMFINTSSYVCVTDKFAHYSINSEAQF